MKFLFHYSVENFSNTYVLGPDAGGAAVLVDPGVMDVRLLDLIETNNFDIKWVLVTHTDPRHLRGLKTLRKIYNAEIYSRGVQNIEPGIKVVKPGNRLQLGEFLVEVHAFNEFSGDAVAYKIGHLFFCGDIISAGLLGRTKNMYGSENLLRSLERRFYTMDEDLVILPGEGPPSLLRSEKMFNIRQFADPESEESDPGL